MIRGFVFVLPISGSWEGGFNVWNLKLMIYLWTALNFTPLKLRLQSTCLRLCYLQWFSASLHCNWIETGYDGVHDVSLFAVQCNVQLRSLMKGLKREHKWNDAARPHFIERQLLNLVHNVEMGHFVRWEWFFLWQQCFYCLLNENSSLFICPARIIT